MNRKDMVGSADESHYEILNNMDRSLVKLLLIYKAINPRQQIDGSEIALQAYFPEFLVDLITLKVQRSFNYKSEKII